MSAPGISIIDAVADPALFAPWFKHPETWRAWFGFLRVLFGLDMDESDLALFRECTNRDAPAAGGYKEAWLVVGSQGGAAAHPAWFRNMVQHPDDIWLEVGSRKVKVRGDSLTGREREDALARIAAIVGENGVGALELLDTHHPEGFRMRRFVAQSVGESEPQKPSQPAEEKSTVTALRRFRPPLRASVTLESGEPVRVVCAKKKEVQGDVLWKAGPWRSSGDWWEREAWARDEWDIALQNNTALQDNDNIALYRLVHDLLGGGWFVEGTYD